GWGVRRGERSPGVASRVIAASAVEGGGLIEAAPDDHLGAGPHGGVRITPRWSSARRNRLPEVGCRVVSATDLREVVAVIKPSPPAHLPSRPDRRGVEQGWRSVRRGGRPPGVAQRVIPPSRAGDARAVTTPDDHLGAGPDREMIRAA